MATLAGTAEHHRDRSLVVAVHDVSPSTFGEVEWLLSRLDAMGIRRRALLVVPEGLPRPPELAALLRREAARGSQIVLHGYTHRQCGAAHGSALTRVRGALFAGGSAEFLGLAPEEMARRVRRGVDALAAAGVRADAFCAPAWLAAAGLRDALGRCGIRYESGMEHVTDLERARTVALPSLGYLGADRLQEGALAALGAAIVALDGRLATVGAFLHPQRAKESGACARVLAWVERLARARRAVTYADLFD